MKLGRSTRLMQNSSFSGVITFKFSFNAEENSEKKSSFFYMFPFPTIPIHSDNFFHIKWPAPDPFQNVFLISIFVPSAKCSGIIFWHNNVLPLHTSG